MSTSSPTEAQDNRRLETVLVAYLQLDSPSRAYGCIYEHHRTCWKKRSVTLRVPFIGSTRRVKLRRIGRRVSPPECCHENDNTGVNVVRCS